MIETVDYSIHTRNSGITKQIILDASGTFNRGTIEEFSLKAEDLAIVGEIPYRKRGYQSFAVTDGLVHINGLEGLVFDIDSALLACGRSNYYGNTDSLIIPVRGSGAVHIGTNALQVYALERHIRRYMAERNELSSLCPPIKGSTLTEQDNKGAVAFSHPGYRSEWFENGLLGLPISHGERINVVFKRGRDKALATYSEFFNYYQIGTDAMQPIKKQSKRIQESLFHLLGRHERSHQLWTQLSEEEKMSIESVVDIENLFFKTFAQRMIELAAYRNYVKSQETVLKNVSLRLNNSLMELPAAPIIDELLAAGSWTEVVREKDLWNVNQVGGLDAERQQLDLLAAEWKAALPDRAKALLEYYGFVRSPGDPQMQQFLDAFDLAIEIFKVESLPPTKKSIIDRLRPAWSF